MATLNRPLTEDEARTMLERWRNSAKGRPIALFYDAWHVFEELLDEPTPHVVRYHEGRVTYTPPEMFFFRQAPYAINDCVWFVPGTEKGN